MHFYLGLYNRKRDKFSPVNFTKYDIMLYNMEIVSCRRLL